jgi:flavin-dependent dehydrogenase
VSDMNYDIVVVGGGLGGSALAKAMAERGARVLVLERERQFRDRVRGEGVWPWGGAEAKLLDIYDLLCDACAFERRWLIGLGPDRDLVGTTPQKLPNLTFYHPEMQEVMLQAAATAGAEVRRGALVNSVVGALQQRSYSKRIREGSRCGRPWWLALTGAGQRCASGEILPSHAIVSG